jgi:hypothetical protein
MTHGLRMYKTPRYDPGEIGIFESLLDFVRNEHNGLYLIRFNLPQGRFLNAYRYILTGHLEREEGDGGFLDKYAGVLLKKIPHEDLYHYSEKGDGAIALDEDGAVIDDLVVGHFVFPGLVSKEARKGTGHVSMALLSWFPGVTTYACSAEKRTIRKFRHGKVIKSYEDNSLPSLASYDL